ncbi:hypothetical protein U8Q07_14885 [Rhizobium ruizarguesonis]|nr:hypothetical protein U8Q07_14885 [Rhizobium ruizarguesonis]
MIRAACENGFPPRMSFRLLGLPDQNITRAPGLGRQDILPETLCILLGNSGGPEELFPLLPDRPAPRKYLRPLFDIWLNNKTMSKNRRVSPLALRKAPFLRALWRVWPLAFDPETKEALLKNCPVCQKTLALGSLKDIWGCGYCDAISDGEFTATDLRDHLQPRVDESFWDDLDFATDFIDPTKLDRRKYRRSQLQEDFESLGDGEVFEVIFALARAMSTEAGHGRGLEIPPPLLAKSAQIVRGWPEALEETFTLESDGRDALSHDAFRKLLYNSRLNPGIRKRIGDIVRSHRVRPALDQRSSLNFIDTVADMKEYRTLRMWMKLADSHLQSRTHSDAIVLRSRLDIREAAGLIGVSIPTLMAMANGDLLPSQLISECSRSQIQEGSREFVQRVADNSSSSTPPTGALRLPRAVAALFNRTSDPWTVVFKALFSGEIEYWLTARTGASVLERVYIEDLEALRLVLARQEATSCLLNSVPMSMKEAALTSRLKAEGLGVAVELGLLSAPYTIEKVMKFRSDFEASTLLAVRHQLRSSPRLASRLRMLLATGGIEPVATYGRNRAIWRRADVERHFGGDLIPCVE